MYAVSHTLVLGSAPRHTHTHTHTQTHTDTHTGAEGRCPEGSNKRCTAYRYNYGINCRSCQLWTRLVISHRGGGGGGGDGGMFFLSDAKDNNVWGNTRWDPGGENNVGGQVEVIREEETKQNLNRI